MGQEKEGTGGYWPAQFTVEAALLMMLILPLLIAVLITGFYLHDRACLQGAACETAAMGSNLLTYEEQGEQVSRLGESLMRSRAMWSKGVTGSAGANEDSSHAVFAGSFSFPGAIARLWTGKKGQIKGSWKRAVYHPAQLIRKVRGVKDFVDVVRADRSATG